MEKIVDKRTFKGRTQYLVHWLGYAENERQWLDISDLGHCMDLIEDFEDNLPLSKR